MANNPNVYTDPTGLFFEAIGSFFRSITSGIHNFGRSLLVQSNSSEPLIPSGVLGDDNTVNPGGSVGFDYDPEASEFVNEILLFEFYSNVTGQPISVSPKVNSILEEAYKIVRPPLDGDTPSMRKARRDALHDFVGGLELTKIDQIEIFQLFDNGLLTTAGEIRDLYEKKGVFSYEKEGFRRSVVDDFLIANPGSSEGDFFKSRAERKDQRRSKFLLNEAFDPAVGLVTRIAPAMADLVFLTEAGAGAVVGLRPGALKPVKNAGKIDDLIGNSDTSISRVDNISDAGNSGRTGPFSDTRTSFTSTRPKGTGYTYDVVQRTDINWEQVRTAGDARGINLTNAEAARKYGLPPQLDDGNFATLHHLGQDARGPLVEASTRYHGVGKPGQDTLHSQFGRNQPHPTNQPN